MTDRTVRPRPDAEVQKPRARSADAAGRPGQPSRGHAPASARDAEGARAVTAGIVHVGGAYDALRAALAALRRSRHPEAHLVAAELAAEAKAALDDLVKRAREADPDYARRQARDEARHGRTLAAVEAQMRRRGIVTEDGAR